MGMGAVTSRFEDTQPKESGLREYYPKSASSGLPTAKTSSVSKIHWARSEQNLAWTCGQVSQPSG
jgi:hypothetical protein